MGPSLVAAPAGGRARPRAVPPCRPPRSTGARSGSSRPAAATAGWWPASADSETALGPFRPSELVVVAGKPVTDFPLKQQPPAARRRRARARRRAPSWSGESPTLRKELTLTTYEAFPAVVVVQTRYTVLPAAARPGAKPAEARVAGEAGLENRPLDRAPVPRHRRAGERARRSGRTRAPPTPTGPTGCCRCGRGSRRRNYMGMNATDYGGGTPVARRVAPRRRPRRRAPGAHAQAGLAAGRPCATAPAREVAIEGEVGRLLQPGRERADPAHLRGGPPGRSLRRPGRIPQDDGPPGRGAARAGARPAPIRSGAAGATAARFTPAQIVATLRQGRRAGVQVGGHRRRLADRRGRLAPRSARSSPAATPTCAR